MTSTRTTPSAAAARKSSRSVNRVIRRIGDTSARRPWTDDRCLDGPRRGGRGPLRQPSAARSPTTSRAPEQRERPGDAAARRALPGGRRRHRGRRVRRPRRRAADRLPGGRRVGAVQGRRPSSTSRASATRSPTDRVSADGRIAYAEITLDVPSTELGRPARPRSARPSSRPAPSGVTAELGGDAAFLNGKKSLGRGRDRPSRRPRRPRRRLRHPRRRRRADRPRAGRRRRRPQRHRPAGRRPGRLHRRADLRRNDRVRRRHRLLPVHRVPLPREPRRRSGQRPGAVRSHGLVGHRRLLRRRDRDPVDGRPGADRRGLPDLHRPRHLDHRAVRHGDRADAAAGAVVAARGPHRLRPGRRPAPHGQAGRGDLVVAPGSPDLRPPVAVRRRRAVPPARAGVPGAVDQDRLPERR